MQDLKGYRRQNNILYAHIIGIYIICQRICNQDRADDEWTISLTFFLLLIRSNNSLLLLLMSRIMWHFYVNDLSDRTASMLMLHCFIFAS